MITPPVVIVGAGLAGLNCARSLQKAGEPFLLLEKNAEVGGRVATANIDGFACDRGFQVLPSGDSSVREFLNLTNLRLGRFISGALIWHGGKWRKLADPRRHPQYILQTGLLSPGGIGEKLALLRWISAIAMHGPGPIPAGYSVADELQNQQLTGSLSQQFLHPWLAGITLDPALGADAGAAKAYVAGFIAGPAALPRGGMAAIPRQLATDLLPAHIRLNASVAAISASSVTLTDGEIIKARHVILATDSPSQHNLLQHSSMPNRSQQVGRGVRCCCTWRFRHQHRLAVHGCYCLRRRKPHSQYLFSQLSG